MTAVLSLGPNSGDSETGESMNTSVGFFDVAHADSTIKRSTCGYFFSWNGLLTLGIPRSKRQ